MFHDANSGEVGAFDRIWDVCVVGTGPAGMTVARRLAAQGLDVALMEAGDLEVTWESQDFYAGKNVGMAYYDLDVTRLRAFGGTSGHWGGRSRPLEPGDFQARPWHRLSGWPISHSDLEPYATETDAILDLPPAGSVPDRPLADGTDGLVNIRFRQSPPTRFAEKFGAEIRASDRITMIYNAALIDLEFSENGAAATRAVFRPARAEGEAFTVEARYYCLCLGGLENPRFLLNANRRMPMGIGNQNDQVGRYFCEHPTYLIADVLFEDTPEGSGSYQPTPEVMATHQMLNFNLLLQTQGGSLSRAMIRSLACSSDFTARLAEQVLGRSVDCGRDGFSDVLEARRSGADRTGRLGIVTEQSLNPDSRVGLSDEIDAFGQRRLTLDWRLSPLDIHTMRAAGEVMGRSLAARDQGRLRLADWLRADPADIPQMGASEGHQVGLHHHMCTTRMSEDPRSGVVDRDCRVHGMDNLYLGGSSTFATVGHANPTYTIVQLALRLGDHLGARLATEMAAVSGG